MGWEWGVIERSNNGFNFKVGSKMINFAINDADSGSFTEGNFDDGANREALIESVG